MGFQLPYDRGSPLQMMTVASSTLASGQGTLAEARVHQHISLVNQSPATYLAVAWVPQATRPVVLQLPSICEAPLDVSSFIEHLAAPCGGLVVPTRQLVSACTRW